MLHRLLPGILLMFVTKAAPAAESVTIPIRIDSPVAISDPWPITCGVPFALGQVKDVAALRVLDQDDRLVPCQADVTATWLQDGSVRWALLNFQGRPDQRYSLQVGRTVKAQPQGPMRLDETKDGITVDTGVAQYFVGHQEALLSSLRLGQGSLIVDSGRGAYVVDNRGRRGRLGGPGSEMSTRFRVKGPWWSVLRKEGWYVTEKGERLARGIVWMHFFGNSRAVKIVHRLILTEDTNKVWFKDVGIDFRMKALEAATVTFASSNADPAAATTVNLKRGQSASMLQEDFPHFMSSSSRFTIRRYEEGGAQEIASGAACGDWCDLSDGRIGLTVVLRDFAEQFPKAFTLAQNGITAHLWAGQGGRELDFRAPTLMKEYWGDWCNHSYLPVEDMKHIPSNAQASAKTHTLWLLPRSGSADPAAVARRAAAASQRVLAFPDPEWTCRHGSLGPPMLHKDTKRFPEAEAYIDDFFDRAVLPHRVFPFTGYIAWGSDPAVRYQKDPKTSRYFAVWWRISGLVDYHMRRSVWALYARSGDRKYFRYGERFNRFAGDFNMHHWDCGDADNGTLKVKGGFAGAGTPKDYPLVDKGRAASPGSLPIYWRWKSGKPGGSGADVFNYLHHFYFSGDWDVWELAEDFGDAMKKHAFLQTPEPAWGGGFVELRTITALWSMNWDEELGRMAKNLARLAMDPEAPHGIAHHFYKAARTAYSMIDYYRLTGDERTRKSFLKMVDYIFRFRMAKRPVEYQSGSSTYFATAYLLCGNPKYLRLAWPSVPNIVADHEPLAKTLEPGVDKVRALPFKSLHYQYHPCVGVPALLKAKSKYSGDLSPLPLLRKNFDSTANAWAVVRKPPGKAVDLEMFYKPSATTEVEPVVLDPDLQPTKGFRVQEREGNAVGRVVKTTSTYVRIRLPEDLPAGEYRIGHRNHGEFVVLNGNADRIVLDCPEGFWLSTEGIDGPGVFYFEPPPGLEHIKLFVNRPVGITRPDGRVAGDVNGKEAGELTVAVDGSRGRWSIRSKEAAFVRFLNLPAAVSYLDPNRLFTPRKRMPSEVASPTLPDPGERHVRGLFGGGLQMRARQKLVLRRGKPLGNGGYENFPGLRGTIEFFFRPNWTATDIVLHPSSKRMIPILNAGDLRLEYWRIQARDNTAKLSFYCGKSTRSFKNRRQPYGNQARFYPQAGRWYHIAATWDIDLKQEYDTWHRHCHVFVDGERYEWRGGVPDLIRATGLVTNYELIVSEDIAIGYGKGTFDELRISDAVRYGQPFRVPEQPFAPDAHTVLLMHFDGNAKAVGREGRAVPVTMREK